MPLGHPFVKKAYVLKTKVQFPFKENHYDCSPLSKSSLFEILSSKQIFKTSRKSYKLLPLKLTF